MPQAIVCALLCIYIRIYTNNILVKPIFHCDAKLQALGPTRFFKKICVGDTNMLVSKNAKICLTPNAKHKICVYPDANPKRESVEYRLHWVPNANFLSWPCTFHVVCAHLFALGNQCEPSLQWNMGLSVKNSSDEGTCYI